ncbi:MAG TPA: hypothetical protein VF474_15065 [Phenylobacterium sp.]
MRFLSFRGWLAAFALGLLAIACALRAPPPATQPASLDHPWSVLS